MHEYHRTINELFNIFHTTYSIVREYIVLRHSLKLKYHTIETCITEQLQLKYFSTYCAGDSFRSLALSS